MHDSHIHDTQKCISQCQDQYGEIFSDVYRCCLGGTKHFVVCIRVELTNMPINISRNLKMDQLSPIFWNQRYLSLCNEDMWILQHTIQGSNGPVIHGKNYFLSKVEKSSVRFEHGEGQMSDFTWNNVARLSIYTSLPSVHVHFSRDRESFVKLWKTEERKLIPEKVYDWKYNTMEILRDEKKL